VPFWNRSRVGLPKSRGYEMRDFLLFHSRNGKGSISFWERRAIKAEIDSQRAQPNNAGMTKPETVRRIKAYSAESGYVYQYQFQDVHPAKQDGAAGNEFVYYVSADRKSMFPIRIFVRRDALELWTKRTGRALTGTEEYAVAKMRLFQALDEVEDFATKRPVLVVDGSNLDALLERLDL
jgi:hypothetical protein